MLSSQYPLIALLLKVLRIRISSFTFEAGYDALININMLRNFMHRTEVNRLTVAQEIFF